MIKLIKTKNDNFNSDMWIFYFNNDGYISIEFFPLNRWNQTGVDLWKYDLKVVTLYALFFFWFVIYISIFKKD